MRIKASLILVSLSLLFASCGGGNAEVQQESAQDQADKMTEELMREMEMEMAPDTLKVDAENENDENREE